MFAASIPTPDGVFVAWFTHQGLARLCFPDRRSWLSPLVPSSPSLEETSRPGKSAVAQEGEDAIARQIEPWLACTREVLFAALRGQPAGPLPPLDLERGTEFQRAVWRGLLDIPCGRTLTYAGLATAIGRPKATRAVGQACGANPIPVLIPCHRVLAHGQRVGGFSAGLEWKRRLLEREGTLPDRP